MTKEKRTDGFKYTHPSSSAAKAASNTPLPSSTPAAPTSTTASKASEEKKDSTQAKPPARKIPKKPGTATAAVAYERGYAIRELVPSNMDGQPAATDGTSATSHDTPAEAAASSMDGTPAVDVTLADANSSLLLHQRHGHQSLYPADGCPTCFVTRARRTPISRTPYVSAERPLATLSADLVGPISVVINGDRTRLPSLGGSIYALVVQDEYTRYAWVKLLETKSQAKGEIISLLTLLDRQYADKKVLRFHSDGGTEFVNADISKYLSSTGIRQTTTTRDKPQHNGKVERLNQTLLRMTRSMLHGASSPTNLWGEALLTATYIYNRTPLRVINKVSPFELLHGKPADASKFSVFGSDVFVSVHNIDASKVQPTSQPGMWLGYDETKNGHRVLLASNGRIYVTRDLRHSPTSFANMAKFLDSGNYRYKTNQGFVIDWSANPEQTSTLDSSYSYNSYGPLADDVDDMDGDDPVPPASDPAATTSTPARAGDSGANDGASAMDGQQPVHDDGNDDSWSPQLDDIAESDEASSSSDSDEDAAVATGDSTSTARVHEPATSTTTTRSGRVSQPVNRYGSINIGDLDIDDQRGVFRAYAIASVQLPPEPRTYAESQRHNDADQYKQAAATEVASMAAQRVYELVPQQRGMNVIPTRWVFTTKYDANHVPIKKKARIVAKGFRQLEGIDYNDTFAPVVKYRSLRILFVLATHYQLIIVQIDYTTAFLNAPLEETLYVAQPEGFNVVGDNGEKLVWRLKKALYGLKQSPREWNLELDSTLRQLGYNPTISDPCIYIKIVDGYPPMLMSLYVDDTVVAYHPDLEHVWLADKAAIQSRYKISDLGPCNWLLNMEVSSSPDRSAISLSQRAYIERMMVKFDMTTSKHQPTPASLVDLTDPSLDIGEPLNATQHELYRQIIGSALYAANTTRVDIAHTVGILARFVQQPHTLHLSAAKRLLRYLNSTKEYALRFERDADDGKLQLDIYADANWGGSHDDRKSTTGYAVLLNGSLVSWQSKKQPTVALSSTEAEYMSLAAAVCEARWMASLLQQMLATNVPVNIYCDNQAAIAISNTSSFSERTKHIDIRHHFVRQYVRSKEIGLHWISTKDQLADILTKSLNKETHSHFASILLAPHAHD